MMRGMKHLIVLLMLWNLGVATSAVSQQHETVLRYKRSAQTNKVKEIKTSCSGGMLKVEIITDKEFSGAVYARGYPNECRAAGEASTTTLLQISSQKCGVKVTEDDNGHHKYELLVYIQFDKWVQQILDEQVHIKCTLDEPYHSASNGRQLKTEAKMSVLVPPDKAAESNHITSLIMSTTGEQDYITIASKLREMIKNRENSFKVKHITTPKSRKNVEITSSTLKSSLPLLLTSTTEKNESEKMKNNLISKARINSRRGSPRSSSIFTEKSTGSIDWKPMHYNELIMSKRIGNAERKDRIEPVSAWMDILTGPDIYGKPLSSFVEVGDDVSMVIKVRQETGLDTRVTSCVAHDGSGDNSQELIDENGCAVDDTIMPPLRVKRTKTSNFKTLFSTFKAFKFPDRDNLHLKCTVLICLGSCSLSICGRTASNGIGRTGKDIKHVGTGSITAVDDIVVKSGEIKKSGNEKIRGNSRSSQGRIVDQVEVFNSVEVRASGIENNAGDLNRYTDIKENINFYSDQESLFCVTPYKMVLSFGILLAIMVAALLFALYSCVKDKLRRNYQAQRSYYGTRRTNTMHPYSHQYPTHVDPRRESPIASPYYRFSH